VSNRSIEKAFRSISLFIGMRDWWHSISSAKQLTECSVAFSSRSCSLVTRSILFMKMRSANATCCTASLTVPSAFTSFKCSRMYLAKSKRVSLSEGARTEGRGAAGKRWGGGRGRCGAGLVALGEAHFESTRQRTPSTLYALFSVQLEVNVWMMGAGSARPASRGRAK